MARRSRARRSPGEPDEGPRPTPAPPESRIDREVEPLRPIARSGGTPVVRGPWATEVELVVDGAARRLRVEPRTTLAQALRHDLGIDGIPVLCDRGACAACTVVVDGRLVVSCMTLAIELEGKRVTTLDGIVGTAAFERLEAELVARGVHPCPGCRSGLLTTCVHLLATVPDLTRETLRAATSGHPCGCGAQEGLLAATLAAARARRERPE